MWISRLHSALDIPQCSKNQKYQSVLYCIITNSVSANETSKLHAIAYPIIFRISRTYLSFVPIKVTSSWISAPVVYPILYGGNPPLIGLNGLFNHVSLETVCVLDYNGPRLNIIAEKVIWFEKNLQALKKGWYIYSNSPLFMLRTFIPNLPWFHGNSWNPSWPLGIPQHRCGRCGASSACSGPRSRRGGGGIVAHVVRVGFWPALRLIQAKSPTWTSTYCWMLQKSRKIWRITSAVQS